MCNGYGCPQGHGLHLEIDPHLGTMTWGPGTLVVYSLIYCSHTSQVTRVAIKLSSVFGFIHVFFEILSMFSAIITIVLLKLS